ncbi:hypothetical protein, partial [Haloarchaeobius sp. DFWS5]|uniref:hypothetical protein n=1 Tax=Haloarchaeobius sp. DFWS5 TaxID=3446114 RepID=UPI003EBE8D59
MTDSTRRRFLGSIGTAAAGVVSLAGGLAVATEPTLLFGRNRVDSVVADAQLKRPERGDYLSYEVEPGGDISLEFGRHKFSTGSNSVSMDDGVLSFDVDVGEVPAAGDTFDLETTVRGITYELAWGFEDEFEFTATFPEEEEEDEEDEEEEEDEEDEEEEEDEEDEEEEEDEEDEEEEEDEEDEEEEE